MAIGNGRGLGNKRRIRAEWDLVPMLHTRLLNGHPVTCCCGEPVTGKYYRFDATHRSTGRGDVLFAGAGCSRDLLQVAPAISPLPLFDPLQPAGASHARRGGNGNGTPGMDPFNAELYAVIHLILMCWGRPPTNEGALSKILAEIRQAPTQALPAWTAKSVNTAIGKGRRSLTAMLAALPQQNPPLRQFLFPRLTATLQQAKVSEVWL